MNASSRRGLRTAVYAAACGCALSACTRAARAQGGDRRASDSTQDSAHAQVLTPTVITATGERRLRTESAVTVDVTTGQDIREAHATHPSGVMDRVAGVHVTELTAEGHSTAIRQPLTTKPMYLYLEDGVPTRATGFFNHNALYEVNLPQAGGVEILKGPGTALYGSDAIGGVVNVLTRPAPPRPLLESSLEGGGYGYARLLATGGGRLGNSGVRTDLNLTRSDGWRDGSAYTRQSGTVRWDYVAPSGWLAKTVVTATSVDQHDVPTLPGALFDQRSTANLAPIAFRAVRAARASTAITKESENTLWSITPYVRHDVLRLLPYWQLSYDPQVWDTRNNSAGVLAKYRRDIEPLHARVLLGTDVDYSPGSFVADQALLTTAGGGASKRYVAYTTGSTQYNYDVTYHSVSPYVHTEITVAPRLRVEGGVRYDVSRYRYDTKIAPVDTGVHRVPASTAVTYRHLSPKIGVTYDLARAVNIYASYRQGFRAPAQSQLFQQNSATNTVGLRPVSVGSLEAGVRGEAGARLLYSVAVYDMRIDNDIVTYVTPVNTREATNAGETRHRGVEASAGVSVTNTLRLAAAYATSIQRYVRWTPRAGVAYDGKLIEQAPRDLGSLVVTYRPPVLHGGQVALEEVAVGRYAMDPANTHYYSGYRVLNAHADYQVTPAAELFARAVNLTDRNYAELVSFDAFQGEQFSPGAPRTVYAGVRYDWTR